MKRLLIIVLLLFTIGYAEWQGDTAFFHYLDAITTTTDSVHFGKLVCNTSAYWYCKYIDAISVSPGGSGATLQLPTSNTLGGYNLDADGEYLYLNAFVCNNWDGATDPVLWIVYEVDVDNSGGNATDTVEFDVLVYLKGDGETSPKSQTLNVRQQIGQSAQYKRFWASVEIDHDDGSNPVDIGDVISMRVNFDATSSDITDVIVNFFRFVYKTAVLMPLVQ